MFKEFLYFVIIEIRIMRNKKLQSIESSNTEHSSLKIYKGFVLHNKII